MRNPPPPSKCEACGADIVRRDGERRRGRPAKTCVSCRQDGSPLRKIRYDVRRGRGVDLGPESGANTKPDVEDFGGIFMTLEGRAEPEPASPPPNARRPRGLSAAEKRLVKTLKNSEGRP